MQHAFGHLYGIALGLGVDDLGCVGPTFLHLEKVDGGWIARVDGGLQRSEEGLPTRKIICGEHACPLFVGIIVHLCGGVVGSPIANQGLRIEHAQLTVGLVGGILRGLLQPVAQQKVAIGLQQTVLQRDEVFKTACGLLQLLGVLLLVGLYHVGVSRAGVVGKRLSGKVYQVVLVCFAIS